MKMLRLRCLALPMILVTTAPIGCTAEPDSEDDVGTETETTAADTTAADTSTDELDTGAETTTAADTSTTGADTTGDTTTGGACNAFGEAAPVVLVAATSAGDAATAPVVSDGQTIYQITLPDGAAGFVELQIPDWETTQVFFTIAEIDYTVTVVDNSQVAQDRIADPSCPDSGITEQDIFFPHWTPALVEFSATGPREIPLMIVQQ